MAKFILFLVLLSFQTWTCLAAYGQLSIFKQGSCLTTVAKPNQLYQEQISSDSSFLYVFPVQFRARRNPESLNIRVEVGVDLGTGPLGFGLECPVLFVINQEQYVTSMELPFKFIASNSSISPLVYYEASRTLCVPTPDNPEMRNITVRVTTCSKSRIKYNLKVSVTEDYLLPLEKDVTIQVSPTRPMIHGFLFRPDQLYSVKMIASSTDNICMTISVQPLDCPIFDQEWNIKYVGLWQTMTKKAAMTVERQGQFYGGFAVALVVHDNDERCSKYPELKTASLRRTRWKAVKLRISDDSQIPKWTLFFCLIIPVVGSLAIVLITVVLFRWRHQYLKDMIGGIDVTDSFVTRRFSRPNVEVESEEIDPLNSPLPRANRNAFDTEANGVQAAKRVPGAKQSTDGSRVALRADVHVGDFASNHDGKLRVQKARRFCWSLVTVSIFYTIPVYQLIFHYLGALYRTGEYDMCYYNYLCAWRVGFLLDFNHFFSNIGYVIFGAAFIIIVRRREANLIIKDEANVKTPNRLSRPTSTLELQVRLAEEEKRKCNCWFPVIQSRPGYGVPQHFGVFYAMGLALIMEGFLSAAYHVCPNQNNFQFDTCFMYVISVLTLLKIYQFRHPVALDANQVFGILAGIILVSVFGLMLEFNHSSPNLLFWFRIIFTVSQFILILLVSLYFYSIGYIRDDANTAVTGWRIFTGVNQVCRRPPIHCDRLILPIITLFLSIAVVVYSEMEAAGFSTYLLYTFIANVLGFCLYYVLIMKPLHGEFKNYTWIQPTFYFIACGIIGGFAVTYFVQTPAEWAKSASESRSDYNMECMTTWFPFQPFYDVHDVWHFYSAAALFLAFMGLLTVDDDLIATPQCRIPVF